jgi:hypothetical protein
MNKTKLFAIVFSLLLFAGLSFGQYATLSTITLTTAVGATDTNWTVSSTTGLTAPSVGSMGSALYVDGDYLLIDSIPSSTTLVVKRQARAGSTQVGHLANAVIFYATYPNQFFETMPLGTCQTATMAVSPYIDVKAGDMWTCYGGDGATATSPKTGVWRRVGNFKWGDFLPLGANSYLGRFANVGMGTVWTGLGGSGDTAGVTTQTWVTSIDVPVGKLITGVSYLAGTTNSGSPHATVALYGPNGGLPIAYSATTVVTATASIWEDVAFTGTIWLAPGRYYVGVQTDASTSHVVTLQSGSQPVNVATTVITGGTYGTIKSVSLTAPTTFTTANGPVVALY